MAIRKTKDPLQCWELLQRMPKSVLAMILCHYYDDLIDNSSGIFKCDLSEMRDEDIVLPVVRKLHANGSCHPVFLRKYVIQMPSRFTILHNLSTQVLWNYTPCSLTQCIMTLFAELRTLPFQRKTK